MLLKAVADELLSTIDNVLDILWDSTHPWQSANDERGAIPTRKLFKFVDRCPEENLLRLFQCLKQDDQKGCPVQKIYRLNLPVEADQSTLNRLHAVHVFTEYTDGSCERYGQSYEEATVDLHLPVQVATLLGLKSMGDRSQRILAVRIVSDDGTPRDSGASRHKLILSTIAKYLCKLNYSGKPDWNTDDITKALMTISFRTRYSRDSSQLLWPTDEWLKEAGERFQSTVLSEIVAGEGELRPDDDDEPEFAAMLEARSRCPVCHAPILLKSTLPDVVSANMTPKYRPWGQCCWLIIPCKISSTL